MLETTRVGLLLRVAPLHLRVLFGPHRRRAGERDDRNRVRRERRAVEVLTVRHGRTELLHELRVTHGLTERGTEHAAQAAGVLTDPLLDVPELAKLAVPARLAAARMHEVSRAIGLGLRFRVRGHRGAMLPVGRRHRLACRPVGGFLLRHVGAELGRLGLPGRALFVSRLAGERHMRHERRPRLTRRHRRGALRLGRGQGGIGQPVNRTGRLHDGLAVSTHDGLAVLHLLLQPRGLRFRHRSIPPSTGGIDEIGVKSMTLRSAG